ncbi:hypothetical protein PFISCL1PPCAC_15512, partial [Pristionchus fissidentatus]
MDGRRSERGRRRDGEMVISRRAILDDDQEQSQAEIDGNTHHVGVVDSDDSDDDVQQLHRKRWRGDEDGIKMEPSPTTSRNGDSEEQCNICFDSFTSSGNHRLVSLRCGHFFGEDCIKRWISSESGKSCPTCKKSAQIKDVRHHFVSAVKSVDNSESESLRQSLVVFQRENEGLRLENLSLRKRIADLCKKHQVVQRVQSIPHSGFVVQRKYSYTLSKEDGSRAFDVNGERIVVSLKLASSPITHGFGIYILDATLRPIGEKVGIANRRIRTIEFCPFDSTLFVIGGEDSWLVVRSIDGGVRKRVAVPAPVWSSCWTSSSRMIVGLSNGRILELDSNLMTLSDVIQWDSRVGVTQIAIFNQLFAVLL